jgi:integrase
MWPTNEH